MKKTGDDAIHGRSGHTRLYVECPLDESDDAGQGALNYAVVRKHFRMAYDLLIQFGPSSISLLGLVVSDYLFEYSSFAYR